MGSVLNSLRALPAQVYRPESPPSQEEFHPWSLERLKGRLVELSSEQGAGAFSLAAQLVWKAQSSGTLVVWAGGREHGVFPLDLAAQGIDLASLLMIRTSDQARRFKAVELLLRSGCFGLVVLDLEPGPAKLTEAVLGRMMQTARKHAATVLFLTMKLAGQPSLGSMVSLRVQSIRRQTGDNEFTCTLTATKDKTFGPGWSHQEVFHGPPGLR